jgi:plastocyanin
MSQEVQARDRCCYRGSVYSESPYYGASPCYASPPAVSYMPAPQAPAFGTQRRAAFRPPSGPTANEPGPTTIVNIGLYDDYFAPPAMNVLPGTTVRWINHGRHVHTVTAVGGLWDSGDVAPGAVYSVTFTRPGTYEYYCLHHQREQMRGTLVVGEGSSRPSGAYGGAGAPGY